MRIAESSQHVTLIMTSSNESDIANRATFSITSENLSTALVLKCVGEGTALDDVIQNGLMIKWFRGQ
jgi:hypothetical protein